MNIDWDLGGLSRPVSLFIMELEFDSTKNKKLHQSKNEKEKKKKKKVCILCIRQRWHCSTAQRILVGYSFLLSTQLMGLYTLWGQTS